MNVRVKSLAKKNMLSIFWCQEKLGMFIWGKIDFKTRRGRRGGRNVVKNKPTKLLLALRDIRRVFYLQGKPQMAKTAWEYKEEDKRQRRIHKKNPIELQKAFQQHHLKRQEKKGSSILPSQEGFAFQNQMLRKLEKAHVLTFPLTSPPWKCVCSLGVMPPPLPSMEIHSN